MIILICMEQKPSEISLDQQLTVDQRSSTIVRNKSKKSRIRKKDRAIICRDIR